MAGLVEKKTPLRAVDLVRRELDLLGVRNSEDRFPEVSRLLSEGKIHPHPLITHTFGFQEIQTAFRLMIDEPEKAGKVVLLF